jgi:hypothetical protein
MPPPSRNDVINLVVTCTNRKGSSPAAPLQARNLKGASIAARAKVWSERLSARVDGVAAARVYKGDHWSVVRSIAPSRGPVRVNVWVASAGYGLVSPKSRIVAYAATLSGGHLDSVASSSEERRNWWASLTKTPPKVFPSEPRSVGQVAARFSSSPLIIAASPEYIDAMADDILAASRRLETPELLSVLCRTGGAPLELMPFAVHLSANLASELGGALTSLNARVLRWLVSFGTARLTRSTITRYISQLSERCSARVVPQRSKMTDAEVREHIQNEQRAVYRSRSALLKVLRGKGYAVEQARFGKIYNEVAEANGAS